MYLSFCFYNCIDLKSYRACWADPDFHGQQKTKNYIHTEVHRLQILGRNVVCMLIVPSIVHCIVLYDLQIPTAWQHNIMCNCSFVFTISIDLKRYSPVSRSWLPLTPENNYLHLYWSSSPANFSTKYCLYTHCSFNSTFRSLCSVNFYAIKLDLRDNIRYSWIIDRTNL